MSEETRHSAAAPAEASVRTSVKAKKPRARTPSTNTGPTKRPRTSSSSSAANRGSKSKGLNPLKGKKEPANVEDGSGNGGSIKSSPTTGEELDDNKRAKKKGTKRATKKQPLYLGTKDNLLTVVKTRKLEFRFAVIKRLIRGVIWEKLGHETLYSNDAYHIVHQALEVFAGHRMAQARRIQVRVNPDRMTMRSAYLEASYAVSQRELGNKEDPDLTLPPIADKMAKPKQNKKDKARAGEPKVKKPGVSDGSAKRTESPAKAKKLSSASKKKSLSSASPPVGVHPSMQNLDADDADPRSDSRNAQEERLPTN